MAIPEASTNTSNFRRGVMTPSDEAIRSSLANNASSSPIVEFMIRPQTNMQPPRKTTATRPDNSSVKVNEPPVQISPIPPRPVVAPR